MGRMRYGIMGRALGGLGVVLALGGSCWGMERKEPDEAHESPACASPGVASAKDVVLRDQGMFGHALGFLHPVEVARICSVSKDWNARAGATKTNMLWKQFNQSPTAVQWILSCIPTPRDPASGDINQAFQQKNFVRIMESLLEGVTTVKIKCGVHSYELFEKLGRIFAPLGIELYNKQSHELSGYGEREYYAENALEIFHQEVKSGHDLYEVFEKLSRIFSPRESNLSYRYNYDLSEYEYRSSYGLSSRCTESALEIFHQGFLGVTPEYENSFPVNDALVAKGNLGAMRHGVKFYSTHTWNPEHLQKAHDLIEALVARNDPWAMDQKIRGLLFGIHGYKKDREQVVQMASQGNLTAIKTFALARIFRDARFKDPDPSSNMIVQLLKTFIPKEPAPVVATLPPAAPSASAAASVDPDSASAAAVDSDAEVASDSEDSCNSDQDLEELTRTLEKLRADAAAAEAAKDFSASAAAPVGENGWESDWESDPERD